MLQVKTYLFILKTFYNDKKFPLISLLLIDKKIVTDIKIKTNFFNKFFAGQWTSLNNGRVLPSSQEFLTRYRLCSFDFSNDEIFKLIKSSNVHKAHGYDDISIRIMKMYAKSLVKHIKRFIKKPYLF